MKKETDMKYIDADELIAEIERRRLSNRYIDTEGYENELLEIITSLQQEQQPSLLFNLDNAAEEYCNKQPWPNDGLDEIDKKKCKDDFKAGAEWMAGLEKQEQPEVELDKELDQWRHKHFKGKRDDDYNGEYLERESQLDLARHFYELGFNARKEK